VSVTDFTHYINKGILCPRNNEVHHTSEVVLNSPHSQNRNNAIKQNCSLVHDVPCTKEIRKAWTIMEYFRCMIGNTAEAWSYCSSRSNGDMLRVRFSYSQFAPSESGVNMAAPLEVCTKDKQRAAMRLRFLASEVMKGAEIHRQLAVKCGQNCLPQWGVYECIEMLKSRRISVVDADR
jgi:hypothetical protein